MCDFCLGPFPYSRIHGINVVSGANRKVDESGRNGQIFRVRILGAILLVMRLNIKISRYEA